MPNQPGTYGTLGTAAANNVPGARFSAVSWTDASGDLWLFGGQGYDSIGPTEALNDLWKYSAGQWTWMGGAKVGFASGSYGVKGVAAPTNAPMARMDAIGWADVAGNLWLFGGLGYDSVLSGSFLNDIWEYSAGQWTWMGGSKIGGQSPQYGTKGTPADSNDPGGRILATSWSDAAGNVWMFGGYDRGSVSHSDLWRYSKGQWTWMSGTTATNAPGTYGTPGVASQANYPGGRILATGWSDAAGDLWLFGGYGYGSSGEIGGLNDLWKYSAGQWTWMSGSNKINGQGKYGNSGVASSGNVPGNRVAAVGWTNSSGDLLLFGGVSFVSTTPVESGSYNDIWKYQP